MDSGEITKIKQELVSYTKHIDDDKVFISSTIYDLKSIRQRAREIIFARKLYPIMSEYVDFKYGPIQVDSHDHCIDEAVQCKHLIYIIGLEYGGEYSGEKYQKEREEIKNLSLMKICDPSISLMEYYVARKNGVDCKVLVLQDVIDKKKKRSDGSHIPSPIDERVNSIVNFINHIHSDGKRHGNWFLTFANEEGLENILNSMDFTLSK